jgi:hypothetical protein
MTKGNTFPAAAPPTDRTIVLREAQDRHQTAGASRERGSMRAELSRRGLLGALATLPAVALLPALAEAAPEAISEDSNQHAAGHANGYQVGCEAFAFAWLAQFTGLGGFAHHDALNDRVWIGWPMFSFARVGDEHERLRAEVREQDWFKALTPEHQRASERDSRSFYQHFWEGKIRQMYDLLEAFPAGSDAVDSIVRLVPALGRPQKREG